MTLQATYWLNFTYRVLVLIEQFKYSKCLPSALTRYLNIPETVAHTVSQPYCMHSLSVIILGRQVTFCSTLYVSVNLP